MKTSKILTVAFCVLFAGILVLIGAGISTTAETEKSPVRQPQRGWKVWVKKSPCSGSRADWLSVATANPTEGGGGSFWGSADEIYSNVNCTSPVSSCTFDEANAAADSVRLAAGNDNKFSSYCCHDYSIWENSRTKEKTVLRGMGTAGFGWSFVKGNLCCEDAEAETGKTGLCGGQIAAGKTGFIGCYKDTSAFDLDGFLERSPNNTPERCVASCRAKGFKFAAVQYGESCLCGNSYGKYGKADSCDYKCTGDPGKICGGYSANSVYALETMRACGYFLSPDLYKKWQQTGSEAGKLGCPTMDEIEAERSPQGTTGRMTQFNKGDGGYIIWHGSGRYKGTTFEVSGCMFKLYSSIGETKSWLGFPIEDGRQAVPGARQDFEGGYILWDSKTYVCRAYKN